MSLASTAATGDSLSTLKELRQRIAEAIDATNSGRDIAALSRQLQIVLDKISEMEIDQEQAVTAGRIEQIINHAHGEIVRPKRYRG